MSAKSGRSILRSLYEPALKGTATAGKVLVCDSSVNITGLTLTNATFAGTLTLTGAELTGLTLTTTTLAGVTAMAAGATLRESASDALTAVGSSQATGLQLTSELNRISTASAGTGVNLPASAAGLTIIVVNNAANPIQVYPLIGATDTIDGNAATTGVTQMVNSTTLYVCTAAGAWSTEGIGTGYSGTLQTFSYQDAMTASAGAAQGGGPITTMIARFTTVASAGNSATLPTAAPGLNITVINAHASNSIAVFPASGDQINSLSANASFTLPSNAVCEFFTTVTGKWHTVLSPSTTTGTGAGVLQTAPTITNPIVVGPVAVAVGSSLSTTAANAGAAHLLNTAGGSTLTLPAATGTGNKYIVLVTVSTTSAAHKVLAASSSDFIIGNAVGHTAAGATLAFSSPASTNHSLQMPNAGTQPSGGIIGDWYEFTDVATNLWHCHGVYQAGTTATTPFNSATS